VVVEQHQPPQKLLRTSTHKRNDLGGSEKTMPANEPENLKITLRQVKGSDSRRSLEAGKAGGGHPTSVTEAERTREGRGFARMGKFAGNGSRMAPLSWNLGKEFSTDHRRNEDAALKKLAEHSVCM
jgi:ABC-type phosphate transport system auxiliary subunit